MFVSQADIDRMGKEINEFSVRVYARIDKLEARIAELEKATKKQPPQKAA